jgi:hypothetical protein
LTRIYYVRDGEIFEETQVAHDEATDEEKARWSCYQQQHVKRIRVLMPEEIVELLNKKQ